MEKNVGLAMEYIYIYIYYFKTNGAVQGVAEQYFSGIRVLVEVELGIAETMQLFLYLRREA